MSGVLLVVGYLAAGWALRDRLDPRTLGTIALEVALPALALRSMHRATSVAWLELAVIWGLLGAAYLFWRAVGAARGWSDARVACLTLTSGLGNTCFVGFPLLEAYVGPEALPLAVQIDQLGTFLMMSTVGVALATRGRGGGAHIAGLLRFPGLWATALGLLLRGTAWPAWLDDALGHVGSLLGPLALVAVGTRIVRPRRATLPGLAAGLTVKLLGAPALACAALTLAGRAGLDRQIAVAEAGMAPAAMAVLLTVENDLEPELGTAMISVGVPLSLLTVWAWVQLLA